MLGRVSLGLAFSLDIRALHEAVVGVAGCLGHTAPCTAMIDFADLNRPRRGPMLNHVTPLGGNYADTRFWQDEHGCIVSVQVLIDLARGVGGGRGSYLPWHCPVCIMNQTFHPFDHVMQLQDGSHEGVCCNCGTHSTLLKAA